MCGVLGLCQCEFMCVRCTSCVHCLCQYSLRCLYDSVCAQTLLSEPVFQALCQGVRARRQNAFHRIEGMMLLSALLRNCAKDVDCVHSLLWTYASSIYNPTPAPELKQREGLLGGTLHLVNHRFLLHPHQWNQVFVNDPFP